MQSENPYVFLSHSGEDAEAAGRLAYLMREAGLGVWVDSDQLRPGDNWSDEIARAVLAARAFAVYVGPRGVRDWVDREVRLALERNTHDPGFPIVPILGPGADASSLPPFLRQHHALKFDDSATPHEQVGRLVALLRSTSEGTDQVLPSGHPPFRGLERFETEDAVVFFGRDAETRELLVRMRKSPLLCVIGASGTGKSSLVRAGLIPALLRGRFHDSTEWIRDWRVAVMRPGDDPFRELANALPQLKPEARDADRFELRSACARHLAEDTAGISSCVALLVPEGAWTLLIVDQFEEVFTQSPEAARRRFIEGLLDAALARGGHSIRVLLTLRADFFSRCWEHPRLLEILRHSQFLVPRPTRCQLCDIIQKPLELARLRVEPGLVERMLEDLGDAPGSLPLLEHALLLLWQMRSHELLTHAAYDRVQGVRGALQFHAEEFYESLDERERRCVRSVLLRLVQVGEGTAHTRRRARWSELQTLGWDASVVEHVLERLVDARLVVVGDEWVAAPQPGPRTPGEPPQGAAAPVAPDARYAELAHEALIHNWGRFGEWLEAAASALLLEKRLNTAVDEWSRSGRDDGYLYRGAQLKRAEQWAAENTGLVSVEAGEFLRASRDAQTRLEQLAILDPQLLREEMRLAADANDWARADRITDYVYRGVRLREALAWALAHPERITPEVKRFLAACERSRERSLRSARRPLRALLARLWWPRRAEARRRENELAAARSIMSSLLPTPTPQLAGYSIAYRVVPAPALGGDLVDVFRVSESRTLLVVSDASGHGLAAARMQSGVWAALRSLVAEGLGPDDLLNRLNRLSWFEEGRFLTIFCAILDGDTGRLSYANGGHNPPMLLRGDGSVKLLEPNGLPLMIFDSADYRRDEVEMASGDVLAVFSDGIVEAFDPSGDPFGEVRLKAALAEYRTLDSDDIVKRIIGDVTEYSRRVEDDMSLLVVSRKLN